MALVRNINDENALIRHKIETACLRFLENLFCDNIFRRRSVCMTMDARDASGDVKVKNERLVLSRNRPKPFATHIQVLSQVHQMLVVGQRATKRDLFYECKELYKVQPTFNRSLSLICKFLGSSRRKLCVIGSSRSFAIGNLKLYNSAEDSIDFRQMPVALFEKFMSYHFVHSSANILLVVEKDATFQKLIDENFTERFPDTILVTGRGYPDIFTREFLVWLSSRINLTILALMDADPHGIEIFMTYKYGKKVETIESGGVCIPNILLIGLRPTEVKNLPIISSHYLPLSTTDVKKCWSIFCRLKDMPNDPDNLLEEINHLQNMGYKLELEAISSISPNYLSSIFLRKKFCELNLL